MVTILRAVFDIATLAVVISGVASKKIYIVGIHITNNDISNDETVKILHVPQYNYYGGTTGAIYLTKKGEFELPISKDHPWFIIDTAKDLYLWPTGSHRISGEVIYYIE